MILYKSHANLLNELDLYLEFDLYLELDLYSGFTIESL